MSWISVTEARQRDGLRLVLVKGFPSPWSVAARWMLEHKGIPFQKVEQTDEDRARNALFEWTGQTSLPAAMLDDERPRTDWYSIALLVDRLAPSPALVPASATDRALLGGLGNEILGELGLLWCVRFVVLSGRLDSAPGDERTQLMLHKYGSKGVTTHEAQRRARDILTMLSDRMDEQASNGRAYLIGAEPTALDFYWAAASVIVAPEAEFGLSERALGFASACREVAGELPARLRTLRDRMFEEHDRVPLLLD